MKRALLVGLVLIAGCEKKKNGGAGDCEIVTNDPAHAMIVLSKKYPNNPVKVAQTIEACVAPTGDECDRVAALVKAIPTMAPGASAPRSADDYAKTCRQSPPEMRKCFLASYALAHDAECKKVMSDMANAAVSLEANTPTACDGGAVIVHVTEDGLWVVTGKDPASRCFGKRQGTSLDKAWLETELAQFKTKDCKPSVDVSGESDVLYQDLIAAMDVAVKVGLTDTMLSSQEEMPIKLDAVTDKAPQHCPATTIAKADMGKTEPGTTAPAGSDAATPTAAGPHMPTGNTMEMPQVVIVTKTEVSLGGAANGSGSNTSVGTVKELAKGVGAIKELVTILPKPVTPQSPLIVQADQQTPASVIDRIVRTAKDAGYKNVLFAVKNK